jgi:hypothetical protein
MISFAVAEHLGDPGREELPRDHTAVADVRSRLAARQPRRPAARMWRVRVPSTEGPVTTTERLESALRLAARVLRPYEVDRLLDTRDVAELARGLLELDGALARGAPFPATWCRAIPIRTPGSVGLSRAVAQSRTAALAIARRVLDPGPGSVPAHDVVRMARSTMELHIALLRGGAYPPDWMAPPARLGDARCTRLALVA